MVCVSRVLSGRFQVDSLRDSTLAGDLLQPGGLQLEAASSAHFGLLDIERSLGDLVAGDAFVRATLHLVSMRGALVPRLGNNGLFMTMLENSVLLLLLDDGFPGGQFHSVGRTCGQADLLVAHATR